MTRADHDDARARLLGGRLQRAGRRVLGQELQLDIADVEQHQRIAGEHRLRLFPQPCVREVSVEARLAWFRLVRRRQDQRCAGGERERTSEGDGVLRAIRAIDADEDLGHVVPRFR